MPDGQDQIRAFLANPEPEANPASFGIVDPLQQMRERQLLVTEQTPAKYEEAFRKYNQQPEVPLDLETGGDWWQRTKASFRTQPEQKLKFWQDLYGAGNVRPAVFQGNPTGGLIIRTKDEKTGKDKDILVDEENFTMKDFGEIAGALPEFIGAVAGGLIGRRAAPLKDSGFLRGLRDITTTSIGAETVGALKDIGVRQIDVMPPEFQEVLGERASAIPRDMLFGALAGLAAKGVSKAITPFGDVPPVVNLEGREAGQYFKRRFEEEVPFSTGEKTGVPVIQRTEAEMRRLPGGAGAYADLREQQNAVFGRIMDRLRGLSPGAQRAERLALPSEEDIGREALAEIQEYNTPYEVAIQNARQKVINRSQNAIENMVSKATVPERQIYSDTVGGYTRNAITQKRDAFLDESATLYNAAKQLPGGRDRILVTDKLSKQADDYIKNKLPSREVITETPTGVLGPSGEPILRTETGRELFKEFIPSNVIGKLRELASSGKTKFSLEDLIAMRNEVSNDIATGESIQGIQTHHLKNIRKMLTDAIDESTEGIANGRLKTAWQRANKHYADNVGQFETKLVSGMLRKPGEQGSIGLSDVLDRIATKADNILELKKVLGAESSQYRMLKRGIVDRLMGPALNPGTGMLDAQTLVNNLKAMRADNRRLFDEVFGDFGDEILKKATLMKLVKPGLNLEAEAIEAGFTGRAKPKLLEDLMSSEKAQDTVYKNQVRKWIGSKSIPGDIKPGEFVSRFVKDATPDEASEIMRILDSNPELKSRIRSKVVENLLKQAERSPTVGDKVALRFDPDRVINSESLLKILGSAEKQRVYENLLGSETMKDLEMLAKAVRPIEQKQAAYQAAGGIAGGMAVAGFLGGKVSQFVEKAFTHKVISTLLTMRPTRAWLENNMIGPRGSQNLTLAAISSGAFIRDLIEEYGQEGAERLVNEMQLNAQKPSQSQPSATPQGMNEIRAFLNQ